MLPKEPNHVTSDHDWQLAHWREYNEFAIAMFVCQCGIVKRVVCNPEQLVIHDPENLQAPYIEREKGRVGKWSGE